MSEPTGRHRAKVRDSVERAIEDIEDGASIMVGGFGLSGNPEALIKAIAAKKPRNLTLISNNAGSVGRGLATWLQAGLVSRVICSYLGNNEDLHQQRESGQIVVDVTPQGTLVERMRAAGAGIAAFYTPTGAGTVVAEGKETRAFDGVDHILETALSADFAFVRAHRADRFGNLRFWRTSRNFAPVMARAASTTIAEVDDLVPVGGIDPDDVHLPGVFVHRLVHVAEHENPIEYRTTRTRDTNGSNG